MTERTAAETERPGEGKTLGEVARDGFYGSHIGPKVEPWHKLDEETQSWWQAAAEAVKATLIPCTFPSCLSAQTAAKAGEEIARLKGDISALKAELSNLIAATKGQTFYHSDEAVNAEMRRLRSEVEFYRGMYNRESKHTAEAYQRGVEEERERVSALMGTAYAHAQQIATKGDTNQEAVIILIGELRRVLQMDPDKVDNG